MIRKRRDGLQVQVYASRDPLTGRKRYVSQQVAGQTKASMRQAKQIEARLLEEVGAGRHKGYRSRTMTELLERWLEWRPTVRPIAPTTVSSYRAAMDRSIIPALGKLPVRQVDATLDAFYTQLRTRGGKDGRPLKARTVHEVHAVLSGALKQAVVWGWIGHDPATRNVPGGCPGGHSGTRPGSRGVMGDNATYGRGMSDEPGQLNPSGEVRASDAEREAVVERLRVATVQGRLTLGELTERTEAAYTATTRGELARVTADLPAVSSSPPVPARPAAQGDREWVVAVMGDSKRQGRWRVERPLAAVAVMGDVVLDLRGAEVPQGEVDITAVAVMGDVKIYVPDGVDVQLSGIAVMGDKKVEVREAPVGQTAPKVVVRATVVMGDVKVLGNSYAEPARRTLRAWLTRDDRDRRTIE